ncbi:MAG TPA: fumarate hydratase, partial [Burkholderiales bacterium]|nr:fumarate hydratase [Burkholderiales bacterium]
MIREADFIESIASALQHISYYHDLDFVKAMGEAYSLEASPAAKDAIAQILTNSRLCAEHRRPICQDTGIVVVFLKIGMEATWDVRRSIAEMVNDAVRLAYSDAANKLRASIVSDPAGKRANTKDNTPAVIHMEVVPGREVEVRLAAKGGGSENKARLAMLNPNEDIVKWVVDSVESMGAGWCPPGMLGIGIGGTAEKAVLLA